jgi:hypothetical protein
LIRPISAGPVPPISLGLTRSIQILFFLVVLVLCFYLSVEYTSGFSEGFVTPTLPIRYSESLPGQSSYVVRVTATARGQIATVTLRKDGETTEQGKQLGGDLKKLRSELALIVFVEKWRAVANRLPTPPPPGLTIEIGDALLQSHVVAVLDAATLAGFTDVALVPIDKNKR